MATAAAADIEVSSFRDILWVIFDAGQEINDLVLGKFRQRCLTADHEGVDRARPLRVGSSAAEAEHTAPSYGDRHVLHAIHHVGRRTGNRPGTNRRLPALFTP